MLRHTLIILACFFCIFCNAPQDTATTVPSPTKSAESIDKLALTTSKNGEWLKAAKLYEQSYLKNGSNEELNYETGTNYLRANYPHKALAILTNFDKKLSR